MLKHFEDFFGANNDLFTRMFNFVFYDNYLSNKIAI